MRTITRLASIVAAFTLLSTLALAAPKAERANKYFKVAGTVIQIDNKDRTLLVAGMAEPGFGDVNIGERVEIRCERGSTEHLARLEDGRSVTVLSAAAR